MVRCAHKSKERVGVERPEDAAVENGQINRGENVIGAEISRAKIVEIAGIEGGVAKLVAIIAALQQSLLRAAETGGDLAGGDQGRGEKLIDGVVERIAVDGIGVHIAKNDERCAGGEAAAVAGVVID